MKQEIIHGISTLPDIIKKERCNKLLVVAGRSFQSLDIKKDVDSLPAEKVFFSGFSPNPQCEQVCKGAELFKANDCDAILAIGGGSAIDVAKCIKMAVADKEGAKPDVPFIAVPTTAGTGSESTHNAVIYKNGEKQGPADEQMIPDYAILEPSCLKRLPLYQKKCTMLDALCQAIESWWSVSSSEESCRYSKQAIELIMAEWRSYIFDDDAATYYDILLAANLSGRAINITATTAAHAMSYKLTTLYGLPHGHSVALCLPEIWEYMLNHPEGCNDPRGVQHVSSVFNQIANAMGADTPEDAIALFRQMLKEMNIFKPQSVNRDAELQILTDSVNRNRLKNNPLALYTDTLKNLYSIIVL